jgi:uncharacterized protein (UPF0212 family)
LGLFNIVRGEMACPHCGRVIGAEVETRLGWTHQLLTLRVGDHFPWNHPEMLSLRPEGGNAVGEGYGECPVCGTDFLVRIVIEPVVIRWVEPEVG